MSHSDDSAGSVAAHLADIREGLMGGRGQGASANEISAATRNRVEVAGMTATRRLELAARQTARARGGSDAITSVIQLREAEVACGLDDDTGRLRPRRSTPPSPRPSRPGSPRSWTLLGVLGAVAVAVLRRKSRH